jgi:hypothetical protein
MSDDRKRWYRFDPDRPPSDAFMEYLEGYASAFDMYPVCSRSPVISNYQVLLDEFWRQLAEDVADALEETRGAQAKLGARGTADVEAAQDKGPGTERRRLTTPGVK